MLWTALLRSSGSSRVPRPESLSFGSIWNVLPNISFLKADWHIYTHTHSYRRIRAYPHRHTLIHTHIHMYNHSTHDIHTHNTHIYKHNTQIHDIHTYNTHIHVYIHESESCSVVSNSLRPHELYSPWNSPGKNIEWVASPFSRGSFQPRDRAQVSHIGGRFFTSWATREAQEYWNG